MLAAPRRLLVCCLFSSAFTPMSFLVTCFLFVCFTCLICFQVVTRCLIKVHRTFLTRLSFHRRLPTVTSACSSRFPLCSFLACRHHTVCYHHVTPFDFVWFYGHFIRAVSFQHDVTFFIACFLNAQAVDCFSHARCQCFQPSLLFCFWLRLLQFLAMLGVCASRFVTHGISVSFSDIRHTCFVSTFRHSTRKFMPVDSCLL